MPNSVTDLDLHDASARLMETARDLTSETIDGKDSLAAASKRSIYAKAFALASSRYCEMVQLHACATHEIDPEEEGSRGGKPNAPNGTPDDLAEWFGQVAIARTFGPIAPANTSYEDPYADERLCAAQLLGVRIAMGAVR